MTKRRPLALGAAVTIGFGSLFFASPALAEGTDATVEETTTESQAPAEQPGAEQATEEQAETAAPEEEAPALPEPKNEQDRKLFAEAEAFLAATGELPAGGGTNTITGETVLFVEQAAIEEKPAVEEFIDELAPGEEKKVAIIGTPVADAATDVVGGAGYMGQIEGGLAACSIGFSAWGPSGDPALITAGHCSSDGAIDEVALTLPSAEPAVGGEGYQPNGTGVAGVFGFSQFGGPGNTVGADEDPSSTDIAVIDITNDDLTLHPEVTDWTTAAEDDLAASTTPVKRVADPVSGTVSKSGRTTGVTSGSTTLNLLYTDGQVHETEILNGWMQISDRWVHGFLGGALTEGGDSGGAVFQGGSAVGVVSGGPSEAPPEGDDWAWYTRLADALEDTSALAGYEVALDIAKPVVESPAAGAHVQPGSDIVVSVASNATELAVSTQPNSGSSFPVENGQVVLQAPTEPGPVTYSLVALNGKSFSETTTFEIVVDEKALAAPGINPVDTTDSTVTLTGTGEPGAQVDVTIDAVTPDADLGSTTVAEDGTWSLEADLAIGQYVASATQSLGDQVSPAATADVTVRPVAPVITSITEGDAYAADHAPSTVSGTGIDGATVTVTVGDREATATVEGGEWTVDLGAALPAGEYTATAVQTVNEVVSPTAGVSFVVNAAPAPVNPTEPGPGEELPITGGDALLPLGLSALAMVLVGGAVTLVMARRQKATEI